MLLYTIKMSYTCKVCNISFAKKCTLIRHNKSKLHEKKEKKEEKLYPCICGKIYLHIQSRYAHRLKCEKWKNRNNVTPNDPEPEPEVETEESKDQKIESLQRRIDELEQAANAANGSENAKQQTATTIQNANEIINNNNTTNNTQNIHINCYGKEDLSYITTEFLKLLINSPFTSIQTLTRHIHFNDEHPENKNVKVTNRKLPYASIHKDGRWQLTDRSKLTEELMHKKYTFLDTMYEDLEPTLSERCKDKFERFQYKYDTVEEQNKIKKDLDLYLLGGIEPSEG